tara:strand:+ start:131 stop:577 length:447 start_codon:yes stop_codon:yes gene_type:complete
MVRKLFTYIFIYTLLTGFSLVLAGDDCDDYTLKISAPRLEKDWKGYYHMEFLNGSVQTFTTLAATTNAPGGNHIYFDSNKSIEWPAGSGKSWKSINHHSYTRRDGTTNAVFCSWSSMVGRTATVTATFKDKCGNTHTDKIKIVIEDKK